MWGIKLINLKWAGVISVIAAILEFLAWLMGAFRDSDYASTMYYVAALGDHLGTIFLIFMFFAIYLVYRNSSSWYNLLCLFVSVVGTSLFTGLKWVHTFVEPFLNEKAPAALKVDPSLSLLVGFNVSFLIFALGLILVGILIIAGKQLPKYTGIILLLAPIVDSIPMGGWSLGPPVSAIAVFLIGLSLLKQKVELKEG
jgi:hypothetical protein